MAIKASGTFGELVEQPVVIALGPHVPAVSSFHIAISHNQSLSVVLVLGSCVPVAHGRNQSQSVAIIRDQYRTYRSHTDALPNSS